MKKKYAKSTHLEEKADQLVNQLIELSLIVRKKTNRIRTQESYFPVVNVYIIADQNIELQTVLNRIL